MYRKNNNIFTTMIANQLFSNYSFKHKMPTSLNSLNSKIEAKQKPNNVNKYLQEIKQESEIEYNKKSVVEYIELSIKLKNNMIV